MDNRFDNGQENEVGHEMAQFQQYPRRDNANRNKANPRFAQRWQKAENNRMALERNNHHNGRFEIEQNNLEIGRASCRERV